MFETFEILLNILPMVLTALWVCWSSNAHKMMQRICKDEGLLITILVMLLCIGCWQLFWIIRLNSSIAENMKHD